MLISAKMVFGNWSIFGYHDSCSAEACYKPRHCNCMLFYSSILSFIR